MSGSWQRRWRALTLTAGLVASVSACAADVGGFVHGDRLAVERCHASGGERVWEPFDMGIAFAAAEREGDMIIVRLASESGQPHEIDQLTIVVEGFTAVTAEIAASGSATRPLTGLAALSPGEEQADVALALLQSCPTASTPLRAVGGEVTFEHLGAHRGERVSGSMHFELADGRSGDVVGVGFVAEFDFEVAISQPHRTFAPPTNR